uniref:Uncharacterized protein n=1 Tax=Glossina palpalis gambiensis TaxID=67801 RepID=A0A1B0B7J5_9MUSC
MMNKTKTKDPKDVNTSINLAIGKTDEIMDTDSQHDPAPAGLIIKALKHSSAGNSFSATEGSPISKNDLSKLQLMVILQQFRVETLPGVRKANPTCNDDILYCYPRDAMSY